MITIPWPVAPNPLSPVVPNAIAEALAERMHACNGGYSHGDIKYMRVPTGGEPFLFDFCLMVQRALLSIIPKFIDTEYNYAANDWLYFPQMLTVHGVCSDEDHNIMLMPPRYGSALDYAAWFDKVCNVLTALHATLPVTPVLAYRYTWGSGAGFDTNISDVIELAHTDGIDGELPHGNASLFRLWDLTASRIRIGEDSSIVDFTAMFAQRYNITLHNTSPLKPMPIIVARQVVAFNSEFNALGTDWVEGLNPLEVFGVNPNRVLDNNSSVLDPDPIPTLYAPDTPDTSNSIRLGYELVPYLDWFSHGGFKYQPDPEPEE